MEPVSLLSPYCSFALRLISPSHFCFPGLSICPPYGPWLTAWRSSAVFLFGSQTQPCRANRQTAQNRGNTFSRTCGGRAVGRAATPSGEGKNQNVMPDRFPDPAPGKGSAPPCRGRHTAASSSWLPVVLFLRPSLRYTYVASRTAVYSRRVTPFFSFWLNHAAPFVGNLPRPSSPF